MLAAVKELKSMNWRYLSMLTTPKSGYYNLPNDSDLSCVLFWPWFLALVAIHWINLSSVEILLNISRNSSCHHSTYSHHHFSLDSHNSADRPGCSSQPFQRIHINEPYTDIFHSGSWSFHLVFTLSTSRPHLSAREIIWCAFRTTGTSIILLSSVHAPRLASAALASAVATVDDIPLDLGFRGWRCKKPNTYL